MGRWGLQDLVHFWSGKTGSPMSFFNDFRDRRHAAPGPPQGGPRLPPWAQIGPPWGPFGLTLAALWLPLASPWPPFGTHLVPLDIPLALAWRFSASLGVPFVSFGDRLATLSENPGQ